MQTFLPFADFVKTARCLDRQRLGKQRVENLQIAKVLVGLSTGYRSHPAVLQWSESLWHFWLYHDEICAEWVRRGYQDTCRAKVWDLLVTHRPNFDFESIDPWWLGKRQYHRSHQSNLLRKDESHYRPFFPRVPADLPYYWPSQHSPRS